MDSCTVCALLRSTCSRQQVRLESLCPVSVQRKGHLFDLSNQMGIPLRASSKRKGCYFVFLIKGPVGASVAMRQCSKAAQTVIMSIIKGAESLVVAVTSPQRELSVFVLTLALRRG